MNKLHGLSHDGKHDDKEGHGDVREGDARGDLADKVIFQKTGGRKGSEP